MWQAKKKPRRALVLVYVLLALFHRCESRINGRPVHGTSSRRAQLARGSHSRCGDGDGDDDGDGAMAFVMMLSPSSYLKLNTPDPMRKQKNREFSNFFLT